MREQLLKLLEPCVEAQGYELIDVEYRIGGEGGGLVRLYIDSPDGVTLDDCSLVSDQVSGVLDVEDPMGGHYLLEVSSPGADRILRKREHFELFAGSRIRVQLALAQDGQRRFTGTLLRLEGEEIVVEVDGLDVSLPLAGIEKARLAP